MFVHRFMDKCYRMPKQWLTMSYSLKADGRSVDKHVLQAIAILTAFVSMLSLEASVVAEDFIIAISSSMRAELEADLRDKAGLKSLPTHWLPVTALMRVLSRW